VIKNFIKKNWLVIIILIIAAFFRLYRISDYMEFLGDQGRDVVIIKDFLKNGNLFFIGPQTSIGNMYLGPYYYYLISPALLIANYNPVGPAVFIALLSILTAYLIYYYSKVWFGIAVGLIASFLYAVSPTVIKYSNFSWNPNIMPIFALLFIYFLYKTFELKKYHFLIYSVLAFIMCLNSHYLALALIIPGVIYFLYQSFWLIRVRSPDRFHLFKYSLIALALFLISLTPQILFDIKHQGQNIQAITNFFTKRETTVNIKFYKSIPNLWPLFNQVNTSLLAAKDSAIGLFISILFLLGLVFTYWQFFRLKHPRLSILTLSIIWYFSGLLSLGLYKQHIYDHYFGFLFPVVFILFGLVIHTLWSTRYLKIVAITLFFLSAYSLIVNNPFRYPPNQQLHNVQSIVNFIIDRSVDQPFNFALLAKQNYDPPYQYFLSEYQAPVYTLHDRMTDQLFVVCEPWQIDCNPINNPQWEIAAFGWAKITDQWDFQSVKIYRLVHYLD